MKVRLWFVLRAFFVVTMAGLPAREFELASPNGLMRRGWTRNSLKVGDVVTVTGWAAKNSSYVGNTSTVTLSDGRKVFAGSSAENETNP